MVALSTSQTDDGPSGYERDVRCCQPGTAGLPWRARASDTAPSQSVDRLLREEREADRDEHKSDENRDENPRLVHPAVQRRRCRTAGGGDGGGADGPRDGRRGEWHAGAERPRERDARAVVVLRVSDGVNAHLVVRLGGEACQPVRPIRASIDLHKQRPRAHTHIHTHTFNGHFPALSG